jgi:hypothetical protein
LVARSGDSHFLRRKIMNIKERICANGDRIIDLPDNRYLVLFDSKNIQLPDTDRKHNIILYDSDGNIIWKVGEYETSHPYPEFISMWIRQDKLYAYNSIGYDYEIDLNTGNIVGMEFVR